MIPLSIASFLLVSCPAYFSHAEGKNSLVNGLFRFCSKYHIGGAPIRLLHENVTTAVNGNQWRLGSWSVIQETKPGGGRERTSEGMPGLSWMRGMCFWACQLAVWSPWALDVDKIVLGLSEVDRGFKFSESSLYGVRKLREGWSLRQTVSLELFHSFMACVMSHNTNF